MNRQYVGHEVMITIPHPSRLCGSNLTNFQCGMFRYVGEKSCITTMISVLYVLAVRCIDMCISNQPNHTGISDRHSHIHVFPVIILSMEDISMFACVVPLQTRKTCTCQPVFLRRRWRCLVRTSRSYRTAASRPSSW